MDFPVRKQNRLSGFDYSSPNVYFITICTDKRQCIFWSQTPVGATIGRPCNTPLNATGEIVRNAIESIPLHYPAYIVEHYVIMPNHVHLLLRIQGSDDGRALAGAPLAVAPTVSTVVAQMKGAVSKQVGFPLWQKGFHDHIVRTEKDYQDIWTYIENNPLQWTVDSLYMPT